MGHVLTILALCLCIAAVAAIASKKTTAKKDSYDERQVAARGRAYQAAFFTLLVYNMLGGALDFIFEWAWAENDFVFGCVGALLALLVFVEMCVWSNAYLRQRDTPTGQMVCLGLLGLVQLVMFAENVRRGNPLIKDGRVQMTVLQLGLGVILVIAELTFLLRRHLDSKADAEEAEDK